MTKSPSNLSEKRYIVSVKVGARFMFVDGISDMDSLITWRIYNRTPHEKEALPLTKPQADWVITKLCHLWKDSIGGFKLRIKEVDV